MLDPAAAGEVARVFGLGMRARLEGPVARGRRGQVWRLVTERGTFAVKALFGAPSRERAEADAAYQEHVRAAGVPMPAVLRATDGAVLAEVGGPHHPTLVRVYEWVDVLPPSRDLDPRKIGALLARVHGVQTPTIGPVDAWFREPVGVDTWAELVERLTAADAPFVRDLAAIVPQLVTLEQVFEVPEEVVTCHCDLWADNVRATPDGGLMLLDWESCGPESPSQELGMVIFEYGLGDPARMLDLYAAYLIADGPGRISRPGDLTMLAATSEHLAEEGCRRWLSATTPEDRDLVATWVDWLLHDPVTPATVDEMLDAVAGLGSRA
ncbi:MAG: aminoglycoside phosphotransferase family protein [Actinomycetales bacterium]|nr:aminoglycoside phosphotransferase family protein [Actinomycetales bacterium]